MGFIFRALGFPQFPILWINCGAFSHGLKFPLEKQIHLNSQSEREGERVSCTANKRFNEILLQIRLALHAELLTNQHSLEQVAPWLHVGEAGRRVLTVGSARSERVPGWFHFSHGLSGVFLLAATLHARAHLFFDHHSDTFHLYPSKTPKLLCNKFAHTSSVLLLLSPRCFPHFLHLERPSPFWHLSIWQWNQQKDQHERGLIIK